MKYLLTGMTFCLALACSNTEHPNAESSDIETNPSFAENLTPIEIQMSISAFEVFKAHCKPLFNKYSQDVEYIRIERGFSRTKAEFNNGCQDYRCRDFGWDEQVYINIKVKDKTSVIPHSLDADGHNLHFFLGGPTNAGMTTTKRPQLCGYQKPDGYDDTFIPIPGLEFVFNSR